MMSDRMDMDLNRFLAPSVFLCQLRREERNRYFPDAWFKILKALQRLDYSVQSGSSIPIGGRIRVGKMHTM